METVMASIHLGEHFEQFVQQQIAGGRYQNASEVVRAGLRLLEDYELNAHERMQLIKAKINAAWDVPQSGRPMNEVFERLETLHADAPGALRDARP
jgi:antitoxin ParD1/3/4